MRGKVCLILTALHTLLESQNQSVKYIYHYTPSFIDEESSAEGRSYLYCPCLLTTTYKQFDSTIPHLEHFPAFLFAKYKIINAQEHSLHHCWQKILSVALCPKVKLWAVK